VKKCRFPEIKAEVKVRQAESQAIRKQINEAHGLDRWCLWQEKRRYGTDTRYLLLAYAFLRGMPYAACEPKNRERLVNSDPVRHGSMPSAYLLHKTASQWTKTEVTEAQLKAWLQAVPMAAQEAA